MSQMKEIKCSIHPKFNCNFIYLKQNVKSHLICQKCQISNNIPKNQLLTIKNLLDSDENEFFPFYGAFKPNSANTVDEFSKACAQSDQSITQMENFLNGFLSQMQVKIKSTITTQHKIIKDFFDLKNKSKQVYSEITRINELKQALINSDYDQQEELHDLIIKYANQAESNTNKLNEIVKSLQSLNSTLKLDKLYDIKEDIFSRIEIIASNFQSNKNKNKFTKEELILVDKVEKFFQRNKINQFQYKIPLNEFDETKHLEISLNNKNQGDKEELCLLGLSEFDQVSSLSLDFSQSNFTNESLASLSSEIVQLKNLDTIDLIFQKNKINSNGVECLISALSKLQQLTSLQLNLSSNSIDQYGAEYISQEILKLNKLTSFSLNLSANQIEKKGIVALFQQISKLGKLSSLLLNLNYNKGISENETIIQLFQQLGKLKNLKSLLLHIRMGQIKEEETEKEMLNFLKKQIHLTKIVIDFEEKGYGSILSELKFTIEKINLKQFYCQ